MESIAATKRENWQAIILWPTNALILGTILLILGAYLAARLNVVLSDTMKFLAVVDLAIGLRFLTPLLSLINILIVGFFLPEANRRIKILSIVCAAMGIISSLTWWVIIYILWLRG